MNDILAVIVYFVLRTFGADYQVSLITAGLFYIGFYLADIRVELRGINQQVRRVGNIIVVKNDRTLEIQ